MTNNQTTMTAEMQTSDGESEEMKSTDYHLRKGRQFSIHQSSEQNNQSDDMNFYGPFSHIRKMLDYTYHKNYRRERQWLQDAIIEEMLECVEITDINGNTCTTPTEPWVVFTAGAMGAGKSHTINSLVDKGLFPLLAFVLVDPDEIRRHLPEYSYYVENSPELAGEMTRKEAGYIAEILTLAGLQAGKNVMVDGSLRDSEWYQGYFARLRQEYPIIRIAILHVVAPREAVFQRAMDRGKKTGRVVPMKTLEMALEQVPKSVKILGPLADYFCELNNAPGKDIELLTEDQDWDSFQIQWLQTCAWFPNKKKKPYSKRRTLRLSVDDKANSMVPEFAKNDRKLRRQSSTLFSVLCSTEENHSTDDMTFYGPYSHIRKMMDYNYHANYKKERQWLQDAIIVDALKLLETADVNGEVCTTPTEPWIIFVAGTIGSGKTHVVKTLEEDGKLPLLSFVSVDYDLIRHNLPEYSMYKHMCRSTAESLTRKETGYIAEIIIMAALQAGKNVVVEGSIKDSEWYQKYFISLKAEFKNLRVALFHIRAPLEVAKERIKTKYSESDDDISEDVLEEQFEKIPESVKFLNPLTDYFCEIDNGADEIKLIKEGETWESFQTIWLQTCAFIPGRKKKFTQSEEKTHE